MMLNMYSWMNRPYNTNNLKNIVNRYYKKEYSSLNYNYKYIYKDDINIKINKLNE